MIFNYFELNFFKKVFFIAILTVVFSVNLKSQKEEGSKILNKDLVSFSGTRVAIRPLPYETWAEAKKDSIYLFCQKYVDMSYEGEKFFNKRVCFPEFYIDWEEGQMDNNPKSNRLVQLIRSKERAGIKVFGVKIAREVLVGLPGGPIPIEERILFESDVRSIRKVLKKAKRKGIIESSDIKLIQMISGAVSEKTPAQSAFLKSKRAQNIVKKMDGLCVEIHHWHDLTPVAISETVKEAKWTLKNDLIFDFYYGPFKWKDCNGYNHDMIRDWLIKFWEAGLPKFNENIIYDLNAFPHDCGDSRPVVQGENPQSIIRVLAWLIEEVKFK